MLRKSTSLALSQSRLFSNSTHPQQALPVWLHSLTGNQKAIRRRFDENRKVLLSFLPNTSAFDPISELLKVSHLDRHGESWIAALKTINNNTYLQPIIFASSAIARQYHFKLLYLGSIPYIKDYHSGSFISGLKSSSFYTPKHNASVIKRRREITLELPHYIATHLTFIVINMLYPLPASPTINEIEFSRACERLNILGPQIEIKHPEDPEEFEEFEDIWSAKIYDIVKPFSNREIQEALDQHRLNTSDVLYQALTEDYRNIKDKALIDENTHTLVTETLSCTIVNYLPILLTKLIIHFINEPLFAENSLTNKQLFSRTQAMIQEKFIEGSKRLFIKEHITPTIISLTDELNKAQENKALDLDDKNTLEELLNEQTLINLLYSPDNLEKIITKVAISISSSSNLNKNNLRENIQKLSNDSEKNFSSSIKLK